jgi:hypothetical protein
MADSFSELEKRRILALLPEGRDLMRVASAKIYTAGKSSSWLYSDLEGLLCYIWDYNEKSRYLALYEFNTYEKLFQMQLYQNFSKFYTVLSEDFHCFETNNGFIGLKFVENKEAQAFQSTLKNCEDNMVNQLLKRNSNLHLKRRDKYKKGKEFILSIKEKFLKEEEFSTNDDSTRELTETELKEGIEVCKPKYYEILNSITYDKEKKNFNLKQIPDELKAVFKRVGLKKSDLKKEALALSILKHIMLCMDHLQTKKYERTKHLLKIENKVSTRKNTDEEVDFFSRKSFSSFEETKRNIELCKLVSSKFIYLNSQK